MYHMCDGFMSESGSLLDNKDVLITIVVMWLAFSYVSMEYYKSITVTDECVSIYRSEKDKNEITMRNICQSPVTVYYWVDEMFQDMECNVFGNYNFEKCKLDLSKNEKKKIFNLNTPYRLPFTINYVTCIHKRACVYTTGRGRSVRDRKSVWI